MGIVGTSSGSPAPTGVVVNDQGFDEEEWERRKSGDDERKKRGEMSEEERRRREAERQAREDKKRAISILRAISIRMPLLIYGAKVDFDAKISLDDFIDLVDNASWTEFMPRGVDKKTFRTYLEYYDRDVFESAGLEIRRLAKRADEALPTARVLHVAQIFRYFKNPDKETVLTPWRVVNLHLSDTLGGWCFYGESFDDAKPLDAPRFVDRGAVTRRAFAADAKILEINSKSGLYPLYAAYSVYRARLGTRTEEELGAAACRALWRKVVAENVFVLCKTPMAASITRRTLLGFDANATCRAETWEKGDLVATLKDDPESFTKEVSKGSFWKRKEKDMTFNAIIGNPPYQLEGGSGGTNDASLYQYFGEAAMALDPDLVSLIIPARWFAGGREHLVGAFRKKMLANEHVSKMVVSIDSTRIFPSVEVKGGICYYLIDKAHKGKCRYELLESNGSRMSVERDLNDFDILIRFPILNECVKRVWSKEGKKGKPVSSIISNDTPFGIGTNPETSKRGKIKIFETKAVSHDVSLFQIAKGKRSVVYIRKGDVLKNASDVDRDKVFIPEAYGAGEGFPHQIVGQPEIAPCPSACTQSYLYASFDSVKCAKNFVSYLKTRFFRVLVLAAKVSQHAQSEVYRFVPLQDFSEAWDDEKLYAKYGITAAERKFIESMIKPMA